MGGFSICFRNKYEYRFFVPSPHFDLSPLPLAHRQAAHTQRRDAATHTATEGVNYSPLPPLALPLDVSSIIQFTTHDYSCDIIYAIDCDFSGWLGRIYKRSVNLIIKNIRKSVLINIDIFI